MLLTIVPLLTLPTTQSAAYWVHSAGVSKSWATGNGTEIVGPPLYQITIAVGEGEGAGTPEACTHDMLQAVFECRATAETFISQYGSLAYNTDECWERKCEVARSYIECAAAAKFAGNVDDFHAAAYRLLSDCGSRGHDVEQFTFPPLRPGGSAKPGINLGDVAGAALVMATVAVAAAAVWSLRALKRRSRSGAYEEAPDAETAPLVG